jgi:hypothetical protein
MSAPNIATVTNIYGKSTYLTPSVNTTVVLLANPTSSGTVYKVNTIMAANIDGTNATNATVAIYTNGAVAQGSAPTNGTAFSIISTVSVPANASMIVLDKSATLYIEENTSIVVTSGTASKMTYTISYEEIS